MKRCAHERFFTGPVPKPKVGLVTLYNQLWRCRDFELQHLWQRSVFLTAFLVLCYTTYGVLVAKLWGMGAGLNLLLANSFAILLCTVGGIFSAMWIMMGKASKAWYERYERAIDAFSDNEAFVNSSVLNYIGFKYDRLPGYKPAPVKGSLFSTKGGAYSPSAINIAIGQVSLIIWVILFLGHVFVGFFYVLKVMILSVWIVYLVPLFLALTAIVTVWWLVTCKKWMVSGMMKDNDSDE